MSHVIVQRTCDDIGEQTAPTRLVLALACMRMTSHYLRRRSRQLMGSGHRSAGPARVSSTITHVTRGRSAYRSIITVGLLACSLANPVIARAQSSLPVRLKQVVYDNAPIVWHETDDNYANLNVRDHMLRADFDGDQYASNNSENAAKSSKFVDRSATAYFSIVETGATTYSGYYYIGYYYYHPRDGGQSFYSNACACQVANDGHDNDFEGVYLVVKKTMYAPSGVLLYALSEAHGALIPAIRKPTTFTSEPLVAPQEGEYGYINFWRDLQSSTMRPVVAIRSRTHGTYFAQNYVSSDFYDRFYSQGFGIDPGEPDQYARYSPHGHSGTQALIQLPVPPYQDPTATLRPDPLYPDTRNGTVHYQLLELYQTPLWTTRSALWSFYYSVPQETWNQVAGNSGPPVTMQGTNESVYPAFVPGPTNPDPGDAATAVWEWRGGRGEGPHYDLQGTEQHWYMFAFDNTDSWNDNRWWPRATTYGNLLTIPYSEMETRFPGFSGGVNEVTAYNPYTLVFAPPPQQGSGPMTVSISGPDVVASGYGYQWTADITGGTAPYTYQWSGGGVGSDQTITAAFCEDGALYLDVWDANGTHVALSKPVFIGTDPPPVGAMRYPCA